MKIASFKMSADTRLLKQALEKLDQGGYISYKDLSFIIAKPVEGSTPALQSAKASLLKVDYVFAPVRGEGLKRLRDDEIVHASDGDVRGLRRKAKKGVRKLVSVQEFAKLDPKLQLQHTTRTSLMTMIADVTTARGLTKVEKQVVSSGRSGELPIAETLAAFMKP